MLTPLVAREKELALLVDNWGRARSGDGRVVLLAGEPGIGKSRLIEALKSKLANLRAAVLEYQCSPLHAQSTLHPFAAELERAAGFCRDDDAAARHDKLEALLAGRLETMPRRHSRCSRVSSTCRTADGAPRTSRRNSARPRPSRH